ncbi:uncharacterized protein LOC109264819 [Panthera pardus]|uniref:Uncharacterized protein LOC109264819 n=1 Tax=Panthera pardus TaxID=9691 RepID=A0A9V1FE22_PANPR|nr:uncharacterized protein LOC109264819 [Panthera pardus]XP_019300895.2 uncharacterized protein LOC109264819 [Panthera pardus]
MPQPPRPTGSWQRCARDSRDALMNVKDRDTVRSQVRRQHGTRRPAPQEAWESALAGSGHVRHPGLQPCRRTRRTQTPRLEPAGVTTDRRLCLCDKRLMSLRPRPSEDSEGSSTHLPTCPHPGAACWLPRARASLQAHPGAGAGGAESKHCSKLQATGMEAPRSPSLCAVTRSTRLSGQPFPPGRCRAPLTCQQPEQEGSFAIAWRLWHTEDKRGLSRAFCQDLALGKAFLCPGGTPTSKAHRVTRLSSQALPQLSHRVCKGPPHGRLVFPEPGAQSECQQ